MVYGADAMIPVEIHSSSWRSSIESPLENAKA
ncbi:hypothetical protein A2U01_0107533, partial [Trifolium medium]|nr:hypothetical protein [Trifolium medium]